MMNRPYRILTVLAALSCGIPSFASSGEGHEGEVTFARADLMRIDAVRQAELRALPAWRSFTARNGTWYVEFNEANAKPHRAYGRPIPTSGADDVQRASSFIAAELSGFGVPQQELSVAAAYRSGKYSYVNFVQQHEGAAVLFSRLFVKMDLSGRVVSFGMDVHDAIDVPLIPTIGPADAVASASAGLSGITATSVGNDLRILPVPVFRGVEHHAVLEVAVDTRVGNTPGHYLCWVDAHSGELLYRSNTVVNHAPPAGIDVELNGTLYLENPYVPAVASPLANARVVVNGQQFLTDAQGILNTGVTGPASAQFFLEGSWSTVFTNGVTPQFSTTLQDGANSVLFDTGANIRERSAFYHVNRVHDHMKGWIPTFTGMDFSLPTNIDIGGNCNAFYDGSSINFYAAGNNCQSYAQIGEVVYHEYGHGINDNFYDDLGFNFNNGAMGEGYADIWALSITEDPIMAEGSSLSDPADFIRRYDQDIKVYPEDLVGQVHADGEIIAGAWWDTYVNMGNDMNAMMTLFVEAYYGLQATTFNGNEGVAYRDVLIDALQADDDDADITNGTPNGTQIIDAFALHGITLISNAELDHVAVESALANAGIPISADLQLTFPFTNYVSSVILNYSLNNTNTWAALPMTNTMGMTWEASIPAQPQGTIVAYWMGVEDIFQQISGVLPIGASAPEPNLPFYSLVGYSLQATDDSDFLSELGNWTIGLPSDNNTTGTWELAIPLGSFSDINDPGTIVQTDYQHTPGGDLCYVTGNAPFVTSSVGENDVDDGTTTLMSDVIDVGNLTDPAFTYWRWYVNNPPTGANPNADWWQVYITADGQNWIPVEDTRTSDRSWRRNAFRIADYVPTTGTVRIKFNASDSIRPGTNLDGGSLVEAAIDDVQLWVRAGTIGIEENDAAMIARVYPDPAVDVLNISLQNDAGRDLNLQVIDLSGRVQMEQRLGKRQGMSIHQLNVGSLASGSYLLRLTWPEGRAEERFQVIR